MSEHPAEFIQKVFDYKFKNIEHLERALTHKSYSHEKRNRKNLPHNEKLEFLGDAVLDLVVSEHLYQRLSDFDEGELSKLRAALVNESHLASIARELELGQFLLLGKGEIKTGGYDKDSILANFMEAFLGALFVDGGYEPVKEWVYKFLLNFDLETEARKKLLAFDPKTRLQELAQEKWRKVPNYETLESVGPDHNKRFRIALKLGNEILVRAEGRSKKQAEQRAAREALESHF